MELRTFPQKVLSLKSSHCLELEGLITHGENTGIYLVLFGTIRLSKLSLG